MREPSNGDDSGSLEDVVNAWWSRYCPACNTRRPMNESTCPEDGTDLRDLSFSVSPTFASTGFVGSTGAHSWTSCPPLEETGLDSKDEARLQPHEDPSSLRAGLPEILGDKWRILRKHGGGAFGTFFIGSHAILGMPVGIKLLRRRFTRTEAGRRLFHQEAMRLSLLNHPGIVKVLDYGEDGDRPYLVMEYLAGKPLHHFIAERSLTLDEGVEVVRQVAVVLLAAHRGVGIGEPLVHLDLKPEHIFLEKIQGHWHVKVIDFGIAEIVATPSSAAGESSEVDSTAREPRKRVAGTLPYMAPERWQGIADARCDIYSLGVVLYELVAGKKPFLAADPDEMQRLHEGLVPPPPSRVLHGGRGVPATELDSIVLWCLEKDAAGRPQTAEALIDALEKWQARPRLSATQRALRAALLPGLVALVALGLFYWAPWEEITLTSGFRDSSFPPVFGPDLGRPFEIPIALPGPGYRGGRAELSLVATDGIVHRVPLGKAQDSVRLTWDQVKDLPIAAGNGAFKASISVQGWLGRTVKSEQFSLLVDAQSPRIERVGGQVELDEDPSTIWVLGSELSITADEPLDAARCRLNGVPPAASTQEGKDRRSVQFALPRDANEIALELVDRAGNKLLYTWNRVRTIEKPRLVSPTSRLTNKPEYPFELRISGSCGKVEIGGRIVEAVDRSLDASTYAKVVTFAGREGERNELSVPVRIWSELSARKDRNTDIECTIQVACWRRSLKIEAERDGAGALPRRFKLVYRDGEQEREVPGADVRWKGEALLDKVVKIDSFPVAIDKDGRLELPRELAGLSGKLTLLFRASDDYGNVSDPWVEQFGHHVMAPQIQFTLASGEGTSTKPLLHKDCPVRTSLGPVKGLDFNVKTTYQEPDALSYELLVGDPDSMDRLPVHVVNGSLHVPEEKLLELLAPGANDVYLVATDKKLNSPISGTGSCAVHYAQPLALEIIPRNKTAVAEDQVDVSVRATGLKILDLKVDGQSVPPSVKDPRGYVKAIPLAKVGQTRVEISVTVAGGYSYTQELSYSSAPRMGGRYVFDVGGEIGQFEIELLQDRSSGLSCWCTPSELSPRLLERFRKSDMGKRLHQRSLPSDPRLACYAEAAAVAYWVTQSLRATDWLPGNASADLPNLQQAKLRFERTGSSGAAAAPSGELAWLSRNDKEARVAGYEASYAERSKSGKVELFGAGISVEQAAFNLVLPRRVGLFEPVNASSWKREEGAK
jgi:serine/threonine protein kinase